MCGHGRLKQCTIVIRSINNEIVKNIPNLSEILHNNVIGHKQTFCQQAAASDVNVKQEAYQQLVNIPH